MWQENIYVVIIPSFLTIAFIGQSIYLHLMNRFQFIPPLLLATWMASGGSEEIMPDYGDIYAHGFSLGTSWGNTMTLTALAATMTVNTLVTGLIVFKILKWFWEFKRTLGSSSSAAGSPNYQHIAFIIIESGMVLFATQLVRIVISTMLYAYPNSSMVLAFGLVVYFHQMLNVIIRSVHFYSFVLLITVTFTFAKASHQQ